MDKNTAKDAHAQSIADKVRQHFRNFNPRQPKADCASDSDSNSSSDSDYPELSASFELILAKRRAQQIKQQQQQQQSEYRLNNPTTSGDCSPPPTDQSAAAAMNRTEPEEETLLFDVLEPSMFERLSPCKRVGLMRPSTVLEEDDTASNYSSSNLNASTASASAASASGIASRFDHMFIAEAAAETPPETSYETALPPQSNSDCSASDFSRDSLAENPEQQQPGRSAVFDDTLEVVEYDRNASKYCLKPVREAPTAAACIELDDSHNGDGDVIVLDDSDTDGAGSPETSFHTARTTVAPAPLKAERTSSSSSSAARSSLLPKNSRVFYADQSLDEMAARVLEEEKERSRSSAASSQVIELDSDSGGEAEVEEAEEEEEEVGEAQYEVEQVEEVLLASETEADRADVHDNIDDCVSTGIDEDLSTSRTSAQSSFTMASISQRMAEPADPEPAALDESLSLTACAIPDEFNDTIERMDYLMDLGRRIQEKEHHKQQLQRQQQQQHAASVSAASSRCQTPVHRSSPRAATSVPPSAGCNSHSTKSTPLHRPQQQASGMVAMNSPRMAAATTPAVSSPAAKKLFRTPIARNSPILKAKAPSNSPANVGGGGATSSGGAIFKRPTALKKTPVNGPAALSRIPKPKSATAALKSSASAFDYVRSPIGAYISQRAPNPMQQNVACGRDFADTSFCTNAANRELDFTLPPEPKVVVGGDENAEPARCRLQKKAYVPAARKQIIDKRDQVIPGGAQMQKLIGTTPLLVTHHGQFNLAAAEGSADAAELAATRRDYHRQLEADDSFNDMSLALGDVSVQVVHNSQR